jgi:hypothetical protein
MLDNQYAILFIRGTKPTMDLKYELTQHPAIRHAIDGGGPPYIHHQKKPQNWLPGKPLFASGLKFYLNRRRLLIMKNPKNTLTRQQTKFERRAKRLYALAACFLLAVPAFAADDPLAVVQKLSDFIFSPIRAVGLILLGYGILRVDLSFQSHAPSQRSNGILTIVGGIVITFTKEIPTFITG